MIGLEFVKKIDKNWKDHVTFADGSRYHNDYCPLNGNRCRREECSLWNYENNFCGFSMNTTISLKNKRESEKPEIITKQKFR